MAVPHWTNGRRQLFQGDSQTAADHHTGLVITANNNADLVVAWRRLTQLRRQPNKKSLPHQKYFPIGIIDQRQNLSVAVRRVRRQSFWNQERRKLRECSAHLVSYVSACRVLEQHRSTQRHIPKGHADEDRLVADMIELARQFGRYGYRRIAVLLRDAGWSVSDGRVEQLWR